MLLFCVQSHSLICVPIVKADSADYYYVPEDSILADNSYQATSFYSLQWWYIDAMLNNNYSVYLGFTTLGAEGAHGLFLYHITVFKNGDVIEKQFRFVPLRLVEFSQDESFIRVSDAVVMNGWIDEEQRMGVNVSLEINHIHVDLHLTGVVKGWKGYTGHGMWGCPLPKALVNGTITIHDEVIPVTGVGYQEHGWNIRRLHRSWCWSKFSTNHTNIVFSQNMKNRFDEDVFIVVVNVGEGEYLSIPRDNVVFRTLEYRWDHGRFIPITSVFQVDTDTLHIDVEIQVQSVCFTSLVIMNRWQLHTRVHGQVSWGNSTEIVDDSQIMEVFHYF
ncbi:MAG: hypothetical protein V1726_01330 [Methanobacteriota archaeon]